MAMALRVLDSAPVQSFGGLDNRDMAGVLVHCGPLSRFTDGSNTQAGVQGVVSFAASPHPLVEC